MKFIIHPKEGVNDIRFGMTQAEVEERLPGGDFRAVRNLYPEFLTYVLLENSEGHFFYFDEEGLLDAVEFSSGIDIELNGIQIGCSQKIESVLDKLKNSNIVYNYTHPDTIVLEKENVKLWMEYPEDGNIDAIMCEP